MLSLLAYSGSCVVLINGSYNYEVLTGFSLLPTGLNGVSVTGSVNDVEKV